MRVVNEMQQQRLSAIAESVELTQAIYAACEHAIASLAIHILSAVARQRGDHRDTLTGQEIGQILLARFRQDREVAAINHLNVETSERSDEVTKTGMQLWSPAGEVHSADAVALNHGGNQCQQRLIHPLRPTWPSIDGAVGAALIAAIAKIQLQGTQALALQGRKCNSRSHQSNG